MNKTQFITLLRKSIKVGEKLQNPKKGTSIIKSIGAINIGYIRGKSTITLKWEDIYDVYSRFKGTRLTTNMLKEFKPNVFDSKYNGHSCNCTFVFMLFKESGLLENICGEGVKNSPYYIIL